MARKLHPLLAFAAWFGLAPPGGPMARSCESAGCRFVFPHRVFRALCYAEETVIFAARRKHGDRPRLPFANLGLEIQAAARALPRRGNFGLSWNRNSRNRLPARGEPVATGLGGRGETTGPD